MGHRVLLSLCSLGFVGLGLCCLVEAAAEAPSRASREGRCDAQPILSAAFENRFEVDTLANVELVMRDGSGQELRRRLRGASMRIDGRMHSLGKLVWPDRLRGMTVLTIEAAGRRSHDAFVYLPSLRRTRRITTAQRTESFFGTDVTYEDLERRHVSDFEAELCEADGGGAEPVYRIAARALTYLSYDRIDFVIARSDSAILETRYFKRDSTEPFRTVTAPRESMLTSGGHVLPTHLLVEDRSAKRTTEVTFSDLVVNPVLDPHLFSVSTLDLERSLPSARSSMHGQ